MCEIRAFNRLGYPEIRTLVAPGCFVVPAGVVRVVDPDIHNSNPGEFKGPRLGVQEHDLRFPEDEALEAVRRFVATYGEVPTTRSWQAAGLTPSEHTIRRRFGSFKAAVAAARNDCK